MRIRHATSHDADDIAANNVELAAESEGYDLNLDTAVEGVLSLMQHPEKGFYLVAEEEGEMMGQLMVTYEWSDWRAQDIWWLQSIYVKKIRRQQGVMRALIAFARKLAADHDVAALRLYVHHTNHAAIKAYQKLGMESLPYHMFSLSVIHRQ